MRFVLIGSATMPERFIDIGEITPNGIYIKSLACILQEPITRRIRPFTESEYTAYLLGAPASSFPVEAPAEDDPDSPSQPPPSPV